VPRIAVARALVPIVARAVMPPRLATASPAMSVLTASLLPSACARSPRRALAPP